MEPYPRFPPLGGIPYVFPGYYPGFYPVNTWNHPMRYPVQSLLRNRSLSADRLDEKSQGNTQMVTVNRADSPRQEMKISTGKPPLPKPQRPGLKKSKTVDEDSGQEKESYHIGVKVPSLDSLYDQLKNLPGVEERLQRLEGDKDSLQMQVSVLMDQIGLQTDKIRELEKSLQDKTTSLQRTEDLLQKELVTKSCNETHKLELLTQMSGAKLRYASLERENLELRAHLKKTEQDMVSLVSQCYNIYGATAGSSSPNKKELIERLQNNLRPSSSLSQYHGVTASPIHSGMSSESPRKLSQQFPSSSSLVTPHSQPLDFNGRKPKLSVPAVPMSRNMDSAYLLQSSENVATSSPNPALATPKRGVAFAETEKGQQPPGASMGNLNESFGESNTRPLSPNSLSAQGSFKQTKGIKGILHRLKKTNSGFLEGDPSDGSFRRSSLRATIAPRISDNFRSFKEPQKPFSEWTTEEICAWLRDMGLEFLILEAQRWISKGQALLDASSHDLEKELGIKNPLHKKKLILALEAKGRPSDPSTPPTPQPDLLTAAGRLDYQWIICWLDDIGLPQYKDVFAEARVDGRVLHSLTVDDLCVHLKVNNLFHVTSLKRGIQVLQLNGYNPSCLQRRSFPEISSSSAVSPAELALWTNHRVMEWLRTIDLSEYAPNMRGSGIHGGLLVYEPRFNVELLATLLSIPQGKTLLRRHLATHFNQLLGKELVQAKREAESGPGFVPLNPVAKVKILKRTQFTLRKKKTKCDEFEVDEWICPADATCLMNETSDSEKTTDI